MRRQVVLGFIAVLVASTYTLGNAPVTGTWDAFLESNQPDPPGFKPAAFGGGVSSAGDVNGDGYDDIIVGSPGWDGGDPHEGAAFVFLGSSTGIVGGDPSTAHAHLESNQFGAQFGTISGAGDVNGDGYDDIIIGAHFYSDLHPDDNTLEVNGAAFVFLGSASGISGTDPFTADAWIHPKSLASDLGLAVAGAGDINGDGYDDVLVGVPKQGIPFPPPIAINQSSGDGGAVLIFHGGPAGITGTGFSDADAVLLPYPPGSPVASQSFMGSDVSAAGDVNGDGYDDIIVQAAGEAVVFLGSASGIVGTDPSSAHARIAADEPVGVGAVTGAGDVNGDGYDDIIIGVPGYPIKNSTTEEGAAFVFLGSAAGITAASTAEAHAGFVGNLLAEWVGASVAGAGDVDGDGYDDVLVTARVYPGSLDNEGVTYLFRGSAAGITATTLLGADVRIEARQSGAVVLGSGAAFGAAGAGDVNGDGFDDVITGKGYWDNGEENEGAAFVYHGESWPANPNQPPVAFAGVDQVVQDTDDDGSETVMLDGSASLDPDGSIVSYAWYEGEVLLGTSPVLVTSLTTTGDHTVVLTVTDDAGLTRGDPVTVRVELVESSLVFYDEFASGFGSWTTGGDLQLTSDPFPTAPQVRLGASGAFLRHSIALPPGSTGMTVSFWGKASQFAATDELWLKVSVDGGPYTTVHIFTQLDSDNTYKFYGGSAIPIGHSWFPTTASSMELEFESSMTAGQFSVDVVKVEALLANLNPVSDAGPDQSSEDSNFMLDGTGSSDPDGSIVAYEWRKGPTLLGSGPTLGVSLDPGTHVVTLTVTDDGGAIDSDETTITNTTATGIPEPSQRVPGVRAYPNPFNPTTHLRYTVPTAGPVSIAVYDVTGALVDVLLDDVYRTPGTYHFEYRPSSASGVYFLRMAAGGRTETLKLLLLK